MLVNPTKPKFAKSSNVPLIRYCSDSLNVSVSVSGIIIWFDESPVNAQTENASVSNDVDSTTLFFASGSLILTWASTVWTLISDTEISVASFVESTVSFTSFVRGRCTTCTFSVEVAPKSSDS